MRPVLAAIALFALGACSAPQSVSPPPAAETDADKDEALIDEVLRPPPKGETRTIDDMRAESLAAIDKEACSAGGGEIRQEGMLGMFRCVTPYADAGKACRSNADCEGKCLAKGDAAAGEEAIGVCQADDSPFGCYAEVEDGKAANAICVD